jgi:hypothetical protein
MSLQLSCLLLYLSTARAVITARIPNGRRRRAGLLRAPWHRRSWWRITIHSSYLDKNWNCRAGTQTERAVTEYLKYC